MAQSEDKKERPKQKDRRQRPVVVISSTSRDLRKHRKQVMDAISRAGCTHNCMETLPATDEGAVEASMNLVDEADIYVGIFAHRYGHIPAGSDISITEMEYRRAKTRGTPCLLFFIHDEHPITIGMVEKGMGADKLKAFKKSVLGVHVVAEFRSPEDLRTLVLHALNEARLKFDREVPDDTGDPSPGKLEPPKLLDEVLKRTQNIREQRTHRQRKAGRAIRYLFGAVCAICFCVASLLSWVGIFTSAVSADLQLAGAFTLALITGASIFFIILSESDKTQVGLDLVDIILLDPEHDWVPSAKGFLRLKDCKEVFKHVTGLRPDSAGKHRRSE